MKSPIVKRSVVIKGHKTSISLEDAFWSELKTIASGQRLTLSALVTTVDDSRGEVGNLSSALRCFRPLAILLPAMTAGSQQQAPGYQEPQPARP
jgi:predicted DNA-binding ribbon-helix-helix protein